MNSRVSGITVLFSVFLLLIQGGGCGEVRAGEAAGGGLYLERIDIAGNEMLSESSIRGALRIAPGDRVDLAGLLEERERLLGSSRMLERVDFSTRPGSKPGWIVLEINVREKERVVFETGYGYHDRFGWFLTLLGIRVENLFAEQSSARAGVKLGFNVTGVEGEWNRVPGGRSGAGYGTRFYIYNQSHNFFDYAGTGPDQGGSRHNFEQEISRGGIELFLGYRLAETGFRFGLKAETVEPDSSVTDIDNDSRQPFDQLPPGMKPEVEKTVHTGLFFRVLRDTRESFLYPAGGSYTSLWMRACNTILGGDEVYTKLKFEHIRYLSIGDNLILSGRLKGGTVSAGAPYYERFYLGGIYSIRGFRELSLSPVTGDDSFWLFSGEYRFPLIGGAEGVPRLAGLLFIDAGQGWTHSDSPRTDGILAGAGYGCRLRLPWLGTLGLDFGIPISEKSGRDNFRVHGSVGFSF
ncbi:MAG: BamA/TamA family outer membrane protein [Candidatus Latescibacteria bacterium]|nr:BamA/TamA family outer membrane protein [bacterium]MBD3425194.1 BamA/TamA family outer membrane protein [Candidatus Latescibacterota bacterium]